MHFTLKPVKKPNKTKTPPQNFSLVLYCPICSNDSGSFGTPPTLAPESCNVPVAIVYINLPVLLLAFTLGLDGLQAFSTVTFNTSVHIAFSHSLEIHILGSSGNALAQFSGRFSSPGGPHSPFFSLLKQPVS